MEKKEGKGLIKAKELYKGMQIDIINLFEYIKNDNLLISFSHFMTVTSKKDFAILNSKKKSKFIRKKRFTFIFCFNENRLSL